VYTAAVCGFLVPVLIWMKLLHHRVTRVGAAIGLQCTHSRRK